MTAIGVRFYDGTTARRHAATLDVVGGEWVVAGDFGRRTARVGELTVSEPMGAAPRLLTWPDGAYCEIADGAGLAALLAQAGQRGSAVVGLQRRWSTALTALAGIAAALALTYLYLLPWAAARLAPAIPPTVNEAISRNVLATLDQHVLSPTNLAPARQQAIARRFAEVAARLPAAPAYRLHFRAAPRLGPNALALPSGDIVVFDALVALADNDDQIAGVLAHELGHVAHHHGMRQVIQSAVVSFVVGIWFGDVSSLAASLGALVLESRYSREFEAEADLYGGRALLAAGASPLALATMLERLAAAQAEKHGKAGDGEPARQGQGTAGVLDSHPQTLARIEALRRLANAGT